MNNHSQVALCNGEVNQQLQRGGTNDDKTELLCNPVLLEYRSSIRGVLRFLLSQLCDGKKLIPLGHGDATSFECFRTPHNVEEALIESIKSSRYNGYAPSYGLPETRRAVAEYVSLDLPAEYASLGLLSKVTPDNVYMTGGCSQAILVCLKVLRTEGSNILLPKPGFPVYETACGYYGIEIRFYDLIPERNWEVDLDHVKSLADEKTVAIVTINPSNPCGAVFNYKHLAKIAETAGRLRVPIISDEVYAHMTFGQNTFVSMATFASITPVIILGGLSKRWFIPGWRLGWIAFSDPFCILRRGQVQEAVEMLMNIIPNPATIVQAAVPSILQNTSQEFHKKTMQLLEVAADICYNRIQKCNTLCCYSKPQGSMFLMVKINISTLKDIKDDMEFALALAREESVVVLPGSTIGMKNWIRISFGAPSASLEEAFDRIELFCQRHSSGA